MGLLRPSSRVPCHPGRANRISGVISPWLPYAWCGAGILSVCLLENAPYTGPLTAARPAITVVDPPGASHLGHRPLRRRRALRRYLGSKGNASRYRGHPVAPAGTPEPGARQAR
jgi:hypothetical protein